MPSAAKPCTSTTAGLLASLAAAGAGTLLAAASVLMSCTVPFSLGTLSLGTQKVITVPAPSTSTVCCRSPAILTRKCSSGFCAATRFTIVLGLASSNNRKIERQRYRGTIFVRENTEKSLGSWQNAALCVVHVPVAMLLYRLAAGCLRRST
jgi:hypothetical protein